MEEMCLSVCLQSLYYMYTSIPWTFDELKKTIQQPKSMVVATVNPTIYSFDEESILAE